MTYIFILKLYYLASSFFYGLKEQLLSLDFVSSCSLSYRYDCNVDRKMVQLKFFDTKNKGIGMISWFAVHPTSMNYTNKLVSSDNVGYASILFEQKMNPRRNLIGKVSIVYSLGKYYIMCLSNYIN